MRRMGQLPVSLAILIVSIYGIGYSAARAADVLTNGGLELSGGPASWTLTQSITGMPGAPISAVEHADSGNEPTLVAGQLGLVFKSLAGNQVPYAGQDKAVNASLSQTVAVGAGQTFTFTGHSFFQASASAIVNTLGPLTPLADYNLDTVVNAADYTIWRDTLGTMDDGVDPAEDMRANGTNEGASLNTIDQADYDYWKARFGNAGHAAGVPSPTQSFFKVEFLNASNVVLGTPVNINLRTDQGGVTEAWRTHTPPSFVSPAGTTQARVTAAATDMVESSTPGAGQDFYFDNFSLNQTSNPSAGEKLVNGNLNTIGAPNDWVIEKTAQDNLSFNGLPIFAAHAGSVGMWLRSYAGGDAKLLQTVAATEDADYVFSGWAKLQRGYIGLDEFLHPEVDTFMKLEFLDGSSAVIGAPVTFDLHSLAWEDGVNNQGVWQLITLPTTPAPAGTAFARISAGAINMGPTTLEPQSAFFDDFKLIETLPAGAGRGAGAVPEPSSVVLLGIAVALAGAARRRGWYCDRMY